jgi:putative transposase
MPRVRRFLQDGLVYHVLNRGNRRAQIFHDRADYSAFLATMADAMEKIPIRVISFELMPNHWHLVLWPFKAIDMPAYMHQMSNAHVRRHHKRYGTSGLGHLYQGRYKSFPVETGPHLLRVTRYVEANAAKARLVERAEDWPWGSLARDCDDDGRTLVVPGPIERPPNWASIVNEYLSANELTDIRRSLNRQLPYGCEEWVRRFHDEH